MVVAVAALFTLGSIRLPVKVAAPSLVTMPPVAFKFTCNADKTLDPSAPDEAHELSDTK
jgi:hypothetical protein